MTACSVRRLAGATVAALLLAACAGGSGEPGRELADVVGLHVGPLSEGELRDRIGDLVAVTP